MHQVLRRARCGFGLWPLLALLAALPLLAADPIPAYQPPTVGHYGPSPAWALLRTLFALAVVVGMIYLTAWLAKLRGALPASPTGYRLKVIETISLGTNRALHLVAVGEQVLLLGSGTEGLRTLATFSAAEVGYDPHAAAASPTGESFLAKLQAFRAGESQPAPGDLSR